MANSQFIHFIPKDRQTQILELPVRSIIAAPHSQNAGTNHWCFYLLTSDQSSVAIDCQPSYTIPSTILPGGSKAILIISELSCTVATDALAQFPLPVAPGLTVKDVYSLLITHGSHKYEFDSNGVGCRSWITEQIHLLQWHQLIVELIKDGSYSQVSAAIAAIRKLWPDETPLKLDRGAYYH
ncbi:uncharacterized protein N7515_006356 [Penicillium bovifimosum]|uniref:DUF7770 domain-containing protein n=1 Tax=Penicillium bovifimosum TaxID=126998 RepID=A0A9W9GUK7_9EURO|nr:uncharacterized protein N7515_006356 [Penicillium bovifimosum]KAJ5130317.1 hypothetical protein N7515_006356 [Penicillium bovifimosum]